MMRFVVAVIAAAMMATSARADSVVDLSGIAGEVSVVLGTILTAVFVWIGKRLADVLKLSADSKYREYVQDAARRAAILAASWLEQRIKGPDTPKGRDEAIRAGVAYMKSRVQDGMDRLKIDDAGAEKMIEARLAEIELYKAKAA
jgi:hypothetical protein